MYGYCTPCFFNTAAERGKPAAFLYLRPGRRAVVRDAKVPFLRPMFGIGVQFRGARMPHTVGGTLPQDQCVELTGGACRRVRTAQLYGCAQNRRPPLHIAQRILDRILLPGAA